MGFVRPAFPEQVWDGLSANPTRIDRNVNDEPNSQDWDRIISELLAVQSYVLGLPTTPDGERFSLYSANASVAIVGGVWTVIKPDGKLEIANNEVTGNVSGLTLVGGSINDSVVYLRQGSITASDWTTATGAIQLTPGANYYLTNTGGMSKISPSQGFVVVLGQAQSLTTFDIDINVPIKL
jgi:hypothetical protein